MCLKVQFYVLIVLLSLLNTKIMDTFNFSTYYFKMKKPFIKVFEHKITNGTPAIQT